VSIILGGFMVSCAIEPDGTDVQEEVETGEQDIATGEQDIATSEQALGHGDDVEDVVEADSTTEFVEAAGADPSFRDCSGSTPFVCYRNAQAWCQPGGHLCGPGHCKCPCEWYCCDSPSNACF
jgi:hypothetical protein